MTEFPSLACRGQGKDRRCQPCAPRAISRANNPPIFTSARGILYLNLKSESGSFLSVLCQRLKLPSLYTVRFGRNDMIDLFPPAFVSSQIAQVDRMRVLERVISRFTFGLRQSLRNFTFFFLSKIEDLENSKSFCSKGKVSFLLDEAPTEGNVETVYHSCPTNHVLV